MDLLLDVGLAGFLLYAVAYVVTVRRAVILFRRDPGNNMIWPLLFLAEVLLSQITESSIVKPDLIYWIFYVSIIFSVSKQSIVLEGGPRDGYPAESLSEAVLTEV